MVNFVDSTFKRIDAEFPRVGSFRCFDYRLKNTKCISRYEMIGGNGPSSIGSGSEV